MSHDVIPPLEIHVHGDVPLHDSVSLSDLEQALRPLWEYAGALSLEDGANSHYGEEPGIRFDVQQHVLHMCWTVLGDEDFLTQNVQDMCANLNALARTGAPIEISVYNTRFDDQDEAAGLFTHDDAEESPMLDQFTVVFVGPNLAAILQVQRELLVRDVTAIVGRHFEFSEMGPVVDAIDQLFQQHAMALAVPLGQDRAPAARPGDAESSAIHHGSGRNRRHLH